MTVDKNTTISVQNTEIKSGEKVFVKIFNGELVERLVWRACGDIVYVCTERVFNELRNGSEAPTPIGFHSSDIRLNLA